MKPYYTGNGVRLYHGDSTTVIPLLDVDEVDLVLTDPPYGVNWQSGKRKQQFEKINGDTGSNSHKAIIQIVLTLSIERLKSHRHIYVFGPESFQPYPVGGVTTLIWDKCMIGPGDLTAPWGPSHEPISFGVKVSSRANRARGDGRLSARLRQGSVLRVPRLQGRAVAAHPTEKPVKLLRMLIESSSLLDECVLDPFAGSGSTLAACILEGREGIGIEIDERHCEQIAKRLERGQ